MALSIRTKIILLVSGILFCALGAHTLMSGYVFITEYAEALQARGFAHAQILHLQLDRLLRLGLTLEHLLGFDEQCRALTQQYPDIAYAMVTDVHGTLLFHNDRSQPLRSLHNATILQAIQRAAKTI
jgi:hypothetical protein